MVRTFWSLDAIQFSRKVAAAVATATAAAAAAAVNSPGRANWSPWKPPQSQSGVHSYVHLPLSRRVCNIPLAPFSLHKLASLSIPLNSSVYSSFPASRTLFLSLCIFFISTSILLSFIFFLFPRVSSFRYNLPTRFFFSSSQLFYFFISFHISLQSCLQTFLLRFFLLPPFTFLRSLSCVLIKQTRNVIFMFILN